VEIIKNIITYIQINSLKQLSRKNDCFVSDLKFLIMDEKMY